MPYKYVPDPILEPYRTIRSEGLRQHTIGTWLNIRDFMAENSIAYDFASDSEQLRVVSALEAFATLSYLAGFDYAIKSTKDLDTDPLTAHNTK